MIEKYISLLDQTVVVTCVDGKTVRGSGLTAWTRKTRVMMNGKRILS
mgnify:CR=1 FL=1|jgi:hypothetical protein